MQFLNLPALRGFADAFGERDETLIQSIAKSDFPPGVKVGGQLEGQGEDGSRQVFTVVKIKGDQVLLDGNHPLAGIAIRLSLKVEAVREATEEEVGQGTLGTGFFKLEADTSPLAGNNTLH